MSTPDPSDPFLAEAASIIAAVLASAEGGDALALDATVELDPALCGGRPLGEHECFVASVAGVGPGEDGAAACLAVKVQAMPAGEAVEHRAPGARSVILDADSADPAALEAEADRAALLLQERFVETLMRTFGHEGKLYEEEAPEPGGREHARRLGLRPRGRARRPSPRPRHARAASGLNTREIAS